MKQVFRIEILCVCVYKSIETVYQMIWSEKDPAVLTSNFCKIDYCYFDVFQAHSGLLYATVNYRQIEGRFDSFIVISERTGDSNIDILNIEDDDAAIEICAWLQD